VFADLSLDAATIASADINGGTIDGVTIGVTSVATVINVDNLKLDGNTLSSTDTNGNVVLAPNGDGDVQLDADTVRVGDNNNDVTITTNGTGDLTLNTNGGTNSGSIEIQDGVNTNIIVTANGTGKLELANGDITTSASSGSDAAGQDLTIQAGASTGNAAGGDMVFQTTPAGAGSGTNLNSYTTVLTLTDDSKMQIGTSTAVNSILDEDDMNSDSDTALATQQSIKAYVDSQVGTVDTWSEVLANGATSGSTDPEIDSGQKLKTNTIEETTADAGVKVDTFTLKDNEVSIDATSGTDTAGTSVTVNSGQGTGTGAGGELLFKVAPAGSAGTSVNALATGMKLDSTKALYVDTINELTSAAGVTIDSVLLKDDVVNATDIETSTISANDGTTAINIADSTGAVDIDTSLNVDGVATVDGVSSSAAITIENTAPTINLTETDQTDKNHRIRQNGGNFSIQKVSDDGATITNNFLLNDNGDIFFYDPSGNASFVFDADSDVTINDNQDARDFTVKSDNNASMLYVDGTSDLVAIGHGSPSAILDVKSTTAVVSTLRGTTSSIAYLDITNYATSAVGVGSGIEFRANSSTQERQVGFITTDWTDNTDATRDSRMDFHINVNGGTTRMLKLGVSDVIVNDGNYDTNFQVKSVNQDNMLFVDAGNDQVSVNGNQNVANAVSGDNVGPKFVVEHSTATSIGILRNDTSIVSGNSIGSLGFYGTDTTSNTPRALAAVQAVAAGTHGAGDNPTELRFYTTPDNSETLTERVTITQGGELQLATDSAFDTESVTTSATTQTTIHSFNATTYTGAKFLVCVTDSTATERYITELLVTHDGTTAVSTEYGQVATDTALATFDVDISSGAVRLLATPASTNSMTFKVMSTQLLA
jgi:hypothetical protein